MKRRSFIRLMGAASFGLALPPFERAFALTGEAMALDDSGIDLSTAGWRLWPDKDAAWKDDTLYLPDEVDLAKLSVAPPTGGWAALTAAQGIPVTLPSSVEEHFWAVYRGDMTNGYYAGVSWWWRTFEAPKLKPGQRLYIRFRAARLRAEVFCNQKLCGYDAVGELPFSADITDAALPGAANQLAVRITNPGGKLAWNDNGTINWGKNPVPTGKAIGGLDAGIILEVRDAVSVEELAVLNKPNPREITIVTTVRNTGAAAYSGAVELTIRDGDKAVWKGTQSVSVPAGGQADFTTPAVVSEARLWDIDQPNLYTAHAAIPQGEAGARSVRFGFRWFAPEITADRALLRLNGKRVVLRSAISWGWWAPNGIFPDEEISRKEVQAAKALGLNCLQFHRDVGHASVFDFQDQLGLMRYEEPGDGRIVFEPPGSPIIDRIIVPSAASLSGNGGAPTTYSAKYETNKMLRMVRRDRSHPSLVIYCIQNEIVPALDDPRIFWFFERIREIDPSRTVYLHSGIAPINQVTMLPYTGAGSFLHEDGTGHSGLRDQHTVGGPGNYRDELYIDEKNYATWVDDPKEIVVWGEILGAGMPDDHDKIVRDYAAAPEGKRQGYDLEVHQKALAAYNEFLDKWKFRAAFPTASDLFQSVGRRGYFFWQKIMENGRMCNDNDFLVISGWESTSIENHSGLVDAHRNLRADPEILRKSMVPELLVVRAKRTVLKPGETAEIDVHLVNETGRSGAHSLTLTAKGPDGAPLFTEKRAVTVAGGDVYGQVLSTGFSFAAKAAGAITLTGELSSSDGKAPALTQSGEILVVDPTAGEKLMPRVAVQESDKTVSATLSDVFGITALDGTHLADAALDAIVLAPAPLWKHNYAGGQGFDHVEFADLYKNQYHGPVGTVGTWPGFTPGPVTLELHFAEIAVDAAGARIFDLAANGAPLLTGFDIFKEAGGKNIALVKTFTVEAPEGTVTLSISKVDQKDALLAGIKLTDSKGKVLAISCQDVGKTIKGISWQPLDTTTMPIDPAQFQTALDRVKNDGIRLVVWPNQISDIVSIVRKLEEAGVLRTHDYNDGHETFSAYLGHGRASWMGAWYFARKHAWLDGLPADAALGWQYQISQGADRAGGLLIDAVPGVPMEVMIGYGRDHEAQVGVGACLIRYGKGTILLASLPGLRSSLRSKNGDISQSVALRLLGNALRPMKAEVSA